MSLYGGMSKGERNRIKPKGPPLSHYEARLTPARIAAARSDPSAHKIPPKHCGRAEAGGHLASVAEAPGTPCLASAAATRRAVDVRLDRRPSRGRHPSRDRREDPIVPDVSRRACRSRGQADAVDQGVRHAEDGRYL